MLFYCFDLGLLLLLIHNAFGNQTNERWIRQSYNDKSCTTPDNKPGYCTDLINCAHLQKLLAKAPLLPESVVFLQKSQCGETFGNSPKVCCSTSNSANTFTTVAPSLPSISAPKSDSNCTSGKNFQGRNVTVDDFLARIQSAFVECKKDEFKCDNGQCIDKSLLCNNKVNCQDKSDETCHHCSNNKCPNQYYYFRCDYGACINLRMQCDGSEQCIDGSDESLRACNLAIDESEKNKFHNGDFCITPEPTYDKIINYQCSDGEPQSCGKNGIVLGDTVALVKCKPGYYTLDYKTGDFSICKNMTWTPPIVECFSAAIWKSKLESIQNNPCTEFEFKCSNKQCIYEWFLCDGISDCEDNSDETYNQCSFQRCGEGQFRCDYGGCIDKEYQCDGLTQCNDGSDEAPSACNGNFSTQNPARSGANNDWCPVSRPSQDKTIKYSSKEKNGFVAEATVALIQCNPGYILPNNQTSFQSRCNKAKWLPPITECLKKCDRLTLPNMDLRCYYKGINTPCDRNSFFAGLRIRPKCKLFYTHAYYYDEIPPEHTEITCNKLGKWDIKLPVHTELSPEEMLTCIHEYDFEYPEISRGLARAFVDDGKSPWQVAIYNQDKLLICGGTIINSKLIISAAHCFTDGGTESTVNIANYEVVVGKFTRNYSLIDNNEQKSFKIRELRFSEKGYFGLSNNFAGDIAIIILEQRITFGEKVEAAVLISSTLYSGKPPAEGTPGKVAGWGLNEHGDLSKVLMTANLTFISRINCLKIVPPHIKPFVTFDKFCAGSDTTDGTTVLQGDSGGGIFYGYDQLQGIVSVKESSSTNIALFTDLADHIQWIDSVSNEVYNYKERKRQLGKERIPEAGSSLSEFDVRKRNRQLMEARISCFLRARNRKFSESICPEFSTANTRASPLSETYKRLILYFDQC